MEGLPTRRVPTVLSKEYIPELGFKFSGIFSASLNIQTKAIMRLKNLPLAKPIMPLIQLTITGLALSIEFSDAFFDYSNKSKTESGLYMPRGNEVPRQLLRWSKSK